MVAAAQKASTSTGAHTCKFVYYHILRKSKSMWFTCDR